MHLHMLMLYDMRFQNWECPLQIMDFSIYFQKNWNYRLSNNKK